MRFTIRNQALVIADRDAMAKAQAAFAKACADGNKEAMIKASISIANINLK